MICISLIGLASLLEFIGISAGGLGILAVVAWLCDDYTGDQTRALQQSEAEGD